MNGLFEVSGTYSNVFKRTYTINSSTYRYFRRTDESLFI